MERGFGVRAGHSLRFGLYDLNSEFDSIETAGLFLNSSHGIGPEIAQTGVNGPSIFPVTSLGARLQWSFSPQWTGRVALLDGVAGDPEDPRRNRIRFGAHDGLLAITELGYGGARLHKVAVGAWTYTERFDEMAVSDAEAIDAEPAAYARQSGLLCARGWSALCGSRRFVAGIECVRACGHGQRAHQSFRELRGCGPRVQRARCLSGRPINWELRSRQPVMATPIAVCNLPKM